MRATLGGYYRNLQLDQNKIAKELFDVTKQISSGQKIQFAYEDNAVFIDTMRLDNEVTTLEQVSKNAQSATQFSTNTDATLNDMSDLLERMKVKLIQAANGTNDSSALNALALELRAIEENMTQFANTSIDGKYLFSGTQITTKPIDNNGMYQGNNGDLNAFLGSGIEQKYNVSGSELFLGTENDTNRKITTNIQLQNTTTSQNLEGTDSIEDMMGFGQANYSFYVRGTNSHGESFKQRIDTLPTDSVDTLLGNIESLYGTGTVRVSLNAKGQIEIEDKASGSSKLDFHMVGSDTAVNDIDLIPAANLKAFIQSGLSSSNGNPDEAQSYDRTFFTVKDAVASSNVSQIIKSDLVDKNGNNIGNDFAKDSTRLAATAAGTTYDQLTDTFSGMSGTLALQGLQSDGATPYSVEINLTNPVTVIDLAGTIGNFDVLDAAGNQTDANDMTYRQLMDVINFAVSGTSPGATAATYNAAIVSANSQGQVDLSYDGKIEFTQENTTTTGATISLFDSDTNDFTQNASVLTFNANNALTISDPKTDFFKQLDEAIKSVELGRLFADGSVGNGDQRNGGIENAIQAIQDLSSHIGSQLSVAGSQSQVLERTIERTELLIVTTKSLRSEAIDTDMAEAALELKQLEINYQAMLSTVSRISQLTLVNYL